MSNKNDYEHRYQEFVELWEDDFEVAEIAKKMKLKEFTIAGNRYCGRYYRDNTRVKPCKINVERMMTLIHDLERKYGKLSDLIPEDDSQLMKLRKVVHA